MEKEILQEMGMRYPKIGPCVVIRFADSPEATKDLARLLAAANVSGWLNFEETLLMLAIVESGDWHTAQNREVRARFPMGIGLLNEHYLEILAGMSSIESIKIANQNPLNALMTGRQKVQKETFDKIVSECLTQEVIKAADSWGLIVEAQLDTTIKALPGIKFLFKNDGDLILTVLLDSWSGTILVDGEIPPIDQPNVFCNGKQVEAMLIKAVDIAINNLTAIE